MRYVGTEKSSICVDDSKQLVPKMSDFTFDHVSVVIRHGLRTPITAFSDEGRKSIKPIEPSFRCDVSEIFKALQIPIVYRKVNLGSRKHFDGDCHSVKKKTIHYYFILLF